eukprot:9493019-Pyramimonas_sp.AAC.1
MMRRPQGPGPKGTEASEDVFYNTPRPWTQVTSKWQLSGQLPKALGVLPKTRHPKGSQALCAHEWPK